MTAAGESTRELEPFWEKPSAKRARPVAQLVLVWSMDEPERLGECVLVDGPCCLGRGNALDDDPNRRTHPVRLRPAGAAPTSPIANARISRLQLILDPVGEDALRIRSVGRTALRVNGVVSVDATVREGDLVELNNAAAFLVRFRPVTGKPVGAGWPQDFRFGAPDPLGIVGESLASWELRSALAFAAGTDRHVLILGESGSGKELAAQAIHTLSDRRGKPFVSRNAATLPEGLVDAELFGNVKNYPNPGMAERPGLIGEADGSTLFLDEIGDLPEKLQVHLLRVMDQGGEYQRLGEAKPRRSSLRLVAATNRPLSSLKHDFLARFTHRIHIPSLDERREDIPLIVNALLEKVAAGNPSVAERFFARRHGQRAEPRLSPALLLRLLQHPFTHHVRELDRLLWLAIGTATEDYLGLTPEVEAALPLPAAEPDAARDPQALTPAALSKAMADAGGSPTKAARALGLKNRYVLVRLLKKHGLSTGEEGEQS